MEDASPGKSALVGQKYTIADALNQIEAFV